MKIIRGSFLGTDFVNLQDHNKIAISWIKPGEKIFSSDLELLEFFEVEVTHTCVSISDYYYQINKTTHCLDNHYFFCTDNYKWLKACELPMKSNILTISGNSEKIESIEIIYQDVKVYNLCTDGTGYFFVNNILVKPILGDIML